ncbi:MAG: CapA family protein [Clostridia bacterium]|nr:CapA family protein [Clostridia bacterium]
MKTLLLGDLCHIERNREYFENVDMKTLFNDTLEHFEGNDICFVNLECAVTESDNAIKKFGPNLKVCRGTVDVMKNLGVTLCGLSNNHIFDFGVEGALDTMKALDDAGITYTGFGKNYEDSRKNYIVEKNGEKIAFIAVCEHEYSYALEDRMGSRPFNEFETMADIRAAKAEADKVIVLYHGGKEYCQYPSPRLINACREMSNNGADVVLCQHTHCIGCYENYNGTHILYGQGNFNFIPLDGVPDVWHYSVMVKYDTVSNEIDFVPTVNTEYGIELAKGEVKDRIMNSFAKRNESITDGTWKDGWHAFCEDYKEQYIISANDNPDLSDVQRGDSMFAHYLDCESHTDVWRELYKTANHRNEK